jgi:hypothetical protein
MALDDIALVVSMLALVISVLSVLVALGFYPFTITNGTIVDDIKTTYRGWKRGDWRKG